MDKAIDFRRLVLDSMDELNLVNYANSFKFHVEQCKSLCSCMLEEFAPYVTGLDEEYLYVNAWSENVQRAWEEVYRAVKEAETYLKQCSTDGCWIECYLQANKGEAFTLHTHDFAWSVHCLFYLLCEMDHLDGIHNDYSADSINNFFAVMPDLHLKQFGCKFQDHWRLLMACNQTAANARNLTSNEKNKIGILQFMERRLSESIRTECNAESATVVPTCLQIPLKDLIKMKLIGEGSFGKVYEGSWLGYKVAIKEIPIDACDLFESEIAVLVKLQSPLIVQLIGACIEGRRCYIVMELVSSTLDKLLIKKPLPLPVAVDMMLQISRGMEYLHLQGIMHMDLKASNILIQPSAVPEFRNQGYGRVKLCDFGMASLRLSSFRCEDPKGTCYWRAPEAFPIPNEKLFPKVDNLKEYTYKADVYSFGMTCYEILTGEQPFLGVTPRDLYRKIVQGERPNLKRMSCPAMLADCVAKCWQTDPGRRPSFAQVSNVFRCIKLLILAGENPHRDVWYREAAFEEIPAERKLELINNVLLTVPRQLKRRCNIHMAGLMPSEKSNAQRDHPLPVFLKMRDCSDLQDFFQSREEVLGKGGFKSSTHTQSLRDFFLAVKRLSKDTSYMSDKRYFRRLLRVLRSVKHLSLRRLPPFHVSEEEKQLIYNNGTLYSLLHSKRSALKWDKRMKIAVNVAAWLAFLHKSGTPHGNLNSSNILLDEDGNACLADSKCLSGIVRNSSIDEYMAPEQDVTGNISDGSDVYSFGVLLVELFTGRNPSSPAITNLPNSRIQVSDMMLMGYRRTVEIIRGMLAVAMLCASPQIYTRPLMSDVVKMIYAVQNSNGLTIPPIEDSFLSPTKLLSRLCPSELSRLYVQFPEDYINENGMGELEPGK